VILTEYLITLAITLLSVKHLVNIVDYMLCRYDVVLIHSRILNFVGSRRFVVINTFMDGRTRNSHFCAFDIHSK